MATPVRFAFVLVALAAVSAVTACQTTRIKTGGSVRIEGGLVSGPTQLGCSAFPSGCED